MGCRTLLEEAEEGFVGLLRINTLSLGENRSSDQDNSAAKVSETLGSMSGSGTSDMSSMTVIDVQLLAQLRDMKCIVDDLLELWTLEENKGNAASEPKVSIPSIDLSPKPSLAALSPEELASALSAVTAFRSNVWDRQRSLRWDLAPVSLHLAYSATCLLTALLKMTAISKSSDSITGLSIAPTEALRSIFSDIDWGILMGSPVHSHVLSNLASEINSKKSAIFAGQELLSYDQIQIGRRRIGVRPFLPSLLTIPKLSVRRPVPRVHCPDIMEFYNQYFLREEPVVLCGCMDEWPARSDSQRKWTDLRYLYESKCLNFVKKFIIFL